MLFSALAALQSALLALLVTIVVVVVVVTVVLYWRVPRRTGKPPQQPVPARVGEPINSPLLSAPDACDFDPIRNPHNAPARRTAATPPQVLPPLLADLLVVDDSAVARAKLRRLFTSAGYAVALARDGAEALALLQKGRYRLMITDLEMPKIDGVQLICSCQGQPRTATMPILAITGHDDLQARLNECQEICGIYRKPWIDEDLASHVALLIGQGAYRQATTATATVTSNAANAAIAA
jgi:CheY-like chemotaxis protein